MKIAVISNSGNVGKTTITREVIATYLDDVAVVEVETHNAGNSKYADKFTSYSKVQATDIETLYAKLVENENVVFDIGASNILDFLRQLTNYAGMEQLFNIFIVPTTKDAKQLQDTIKTITILTKFSISPEQIVVVANRANPSSFERDFEILINAQKQFNFRFNKDLMIRETSLLKDLEVFGKTLNDVVNDTTDYRQKIIETSGTDEQKKWVKLDLAKMAGKTVYEDFKRVFTAIIGD